MLLCALAFFILSASLLGTPLSWELLIGVESPANHDFPILAWTLSIFGYLLIPALIGLTVSVAAEIQVQGRINSLADQLSTLEESLDLGLAADSSDAISGTLPPAGSGPGADVTTSEAASGNSGDLDDDSRPTGSQQ